MFAALSIYLFDSVAVAVNVSGTGFSADLMLSDGNSGQFSVTNNPAGVVADFTGTTAQADQVSLEITSLRADGTFVSELDVKYGFAKAAKHTSFDAAPMTCYK